MTDFKLHEIYKPSEKEALVDIVFVHGLSGDAFTSWQYDTGEENKPFWPEWLEEEFPSANVYSLAYPSSFFASFIDDGGMDLLERAKASLELLKAEGIGNRPTIFMCHSLGGLIVKALLSKAEDLKSSENELFLKKTVGVVFFGTPHLGSPLANFVKMFPLLSSIASGNKPSVAASNKTTDLKKASRMLKELKEWFSSNAIHYEVQVLTFYEKHKTNGIITVDETSSDPGVSGSTFTPVEANHSDMCKFKDRDNSTYKMVVHFIKKTLDDIGVFLNDKNGPDDLEYYINTVEGDRYTLEEKLRNGGRDDESEIEAAEREKERISKIIERNSLSTTNRQEYRKYLGDVLSRFRLHVKPVINEGADILTVNQAIQDSVINQVEEKSKKEGYALGQPADIHAAIYYLTGKCHINWGKKKND